MVTIALRCLWLWQPERQLLLHQSSFRYAIEHRDWARVQSLIDPTYSDRWGYTRDTGIAEARQWLGQFFVLTITPTPVSDQLTPGGGQVTEQWTLGGTGSEAAPEIIDRLNHVTTPFTFQWKHNSWKPWDWTLLHIDNPTLNLTSPDI